MPKGIPLTPQELSRRRSEIMASAMHLFIEKGFAETSMREIAEVAGVGKSTLYDYFPSKDEILISFVIDEVHYMEAKAQEIFAQQLSAIEKFRRILRIHVEYVAANKLIYLKLTFEAQRLSMESQQRIQSHRHAYQDMLCQLIEEGIRNGEFRPVNPLMAVRGVFSFLNSFIYTSRPTGSPEQMLQDAMEILFKGLEA